MNYKQLIALVFCIGGLNCNAQNNFPKDLDFEGLKGQPKTIVETTQMQGVEQTTKEIYHFDNSGYLTKIEHYNWYDKDEDSLYLGDVTYYKTPNINSKIAITLRHQSTDTVRLKTYLLKNDSIINVKIKEYNNAFKTNVVQQLDDTNRIIKTVTRITDTISKTIKVNSITDFIYKEGDLEKLLITNDRTGNASKSVVIANEKKDDLGNFIYREYIDDTNEIVYKVERTYVYY